MSAGKTAKKIINVRVDSETAKVLKTRCKEEHISMTKVIGGLVAEYLARPTKKETASGEVAGTPAGEGVSP